VKPGIIGMTVRTFKINSRSAEPDPVAGAETGTTGRTSEQAGRVRGFARSGLPDPPRLLSDAAVTGRCAVLVPLPVRAMRAVR
jgi:hypothetical protein